MDPPVSDSAVRQSRIGLDIKVYIHHLDIMTSQYCQDTVEEILTEIGGTCVLMRTRLIARVVTAIHDEALQSFGVGAAQFVLLVVIGKLGPSSRAEIGRYHRQDRSTLSRNLKVIMTEGWVEEDPTRVHGRVRPLVLTDAGKELLIKATPAWREAQAQAKKVLGQAGTVAVMDIADNILSKPEAV
jgi:DNA-binding MarR family transcriptional regulator